MQNPIAFMSMSELVVRIKAGDISCVDATHAVLKQIETHNEAINAIVTLNDQARKQALLADESLKRGEAVGNFHGIPFTVKDFFKTKGIRSTASHKPMSGHIPDSDATVVMRSYDAGGILIGKTNLPEMAMDSQTNSPLFGRTRNPWNVEHTPGGSSGGGAAAVASGMSFMDIGNDLLGSVRIPSHFCGIFSLVPTEKTIPSSGLLVAKPECGSLSRMMRPGMMTRSLSDLRMALKSLTGPDHDEPDGLSLNVLSLDKPVPGKLSIGWAYNAGGLPVSNATQIILEGFIERLSADHTITRIDQTHFDFNASRETFLKIFQPVMATKLPFVVRMLTRLFGAKCMDISLRKYLDAEYRRNYLIADMNRLFDHYDVLLCPVTATPPFPHLSPDGYAGMNPIYRKGIRWENETYPYAQANLGFAIPFTVTGNPVVTLPVSLTKEGLPVGIQVIGRRYEDFRLIEVARVLNGYTESIGHPPLEKHQ